MTADEWDNESTPSLLCDQLPDRPVFARERRLLLTACVRVLLQGSRKPLMELIDVAEDLADGATAHEQRREAIRGLTTTRSVTRVGLGTQTLALALQKDVSQANIRALVNGLEDLLLTPERVLLSMEMLCDLLRDIFGNPFRSIRIDASWRTPTTIAIATQMYESRDFRPMLILADALEDAGCENAEILDHCRHPEGMHARGCWVADAVLGKK